MFRSFLVQYVADLISCSNDTYNINENDMEDIIDSLENNENLWSIIDEAVYQEIDKYIEED